MLFLPGDFAREAWNTEKLIKAYEAKKKLEIIGAMTFSSAVKRKTKQAVMKDIIQWLCRFQSKKNLLQTTLFSDVL